MDQWLDDAPHPRAEVSELDPLVWDDDLLTDLVVAEDTVRRVLARLEDGAHWPAGVALTEEPVARAWQLAGIAPLGPLDQVELLRSATMADLLEGIVSKTEAVVFP